MTETNSNSKIYENAVLFYITGIQYVVTCCAFCSERKFKYPFYKNWPLMALMFIMVGSVYYVLITE